MKKILLFLFFISATFVGKGQNLVPNGDFELYSGCPNHFSQIDSCLFWFNPAQWPGLGGTPDYYNQCASPAFVGVPNNWGGYQNAHSNAAYSGIFLWSANASNAREYIEVPLISPLILNQCYYFEMYISLANCEYTTDNIQVYFSDTAVTGIPNYYPLPFTPQLSNTSGNIFDTLNWILVSGNYLADGGENFLIIGNFKDDANTDTIMINPTALSPSLYVYIDDVSVTPCTGIEEQNQNSGIKIYPNPVSDELKVSGLKFKVGDEVKILDVMGKEVLKSGITNPKSEMKIDMRSFSKGVYFIKVSTDEKEEIKKVIKIE